MFHFIKYSQGRHGTATVNFSGAVFSVVLINVLERK